MAKAEQDGHLNDVLKPFYQRANEAEERLSRLEAAVDGKDLHVPTKKDCGNEELMSLINELQEKLELPEDEKVSEQEKILKVVQKLLVENRKMEYRIMHLVRALKESDRKVEVEGATNDS